jgi:hypothetical protein
MRSKTGKKASWVKPKGEGKAWGMGASLVGKDLEGKRVRALSMQFLGLLCPLGKSWG